MTLVALAAVPAAQAEPPLVKAQSARAFGNSVGVNGYFAWLDTAYGDFDTIVSRLRELGVRNVRDGLCPTCEYQIDRLNRLAALGIKSNILVGTLAQGSARMQQSLAVIRSRLRDSVISVESPNEPNLSGDPNWIQHARDYQRDLWTRVKGDPQLAHLTVLGPAVGWPASPVQLGDLSAYLDRGNMHPYPGGNPPYYNIASEKLMGAAVAKGKPLIATESGYHSALGTTGGHLPASERASAYYMPRLALEGFYNGVDKTYVYQLADPWPSSSSPVSPEENSFGLLRSDLSRKPSFLALRNLLDAAGGDSAPVADPGGLRFALRGAGPDVRQLLLRSADGSFALVLWRGASVWDPVNRRDLSPAPDRVDVDFGDRITLARRFDPVASGSEQQRWTDTRGVSVDLAGAPVVLRLTPADGATGTDKRSQNRSRKAMRRRAACAAAFGRTPRAACCKARAHRKLSRKQAQRRKRAHARAGRRHKSASWARSCVSHRRR